jgi:hypothetical protein
VLGCFGVVSSLRLQIGQHDGRQFQVNAHLTGQRVQHGAVLLRGSHGTLSQQGSQVIDVAAEGGQFGAGRGQCSDVVGAVGARTQYWYARNEPGQIRTTRQAC